MDNLFVSFIKDAHPLVDLVPPSSVPVNIRDWWVIAEFNGDWPAGVIEADLLVEQISSKFPGCAGTQALDCGTICVLVQPDKPVLLEAERLLRLLMEENTLSSQERFARMQPSIDAYWQAAKLHQRLRLFDELGVAPHGVLANSCPPELRELCDDHLNSNW